MEMNNDGLIAATIRGFLDSHEYKYEYEEDKSCFSMGFNLDNDRVKVRIIFNEEREWFSVFVYPSHSVPVKQIEKILPVLNKINYEVLFGTIYCDPEDGELAVRCSASVDDRSVNESMVGVMLSTALNIADDKIADIMKALYS
ncbi:MAG: YbjN domain-containing protein [Muribaculaceae bacterium]|nr:YbjN domain-containing protein [Muribaculaceae bacterium]